MDANDYKDTLTLAQHGQQHLTQLIRDAERLVDYFQIIEQRETERKSKDEEASKALLTAVFGRPTHLNVNIPSFSAAEIEAANKATAQEVEESMERLRDSVVVKVYETTYEPLPFDKNHPRWAECQKWIMTNRPLGGSNYYNSLLKDWMQTYYHPTYVKKVTEKTTK